MSRYVVYKLLGDSDAPGIIESFGHLKGVLVGEYDENPLYMCPPVWMCPQDPDVIHLCRAQNELMRQERKDEHDAD